jgi:ubiquinone biosynthesis protein
MASLLGFGTIGHLWRLARVGFVLAREGALGVVDPVMLPAGPAFLVKMARLIERKDSTSAPQRLARAIARLGPSYVKYGQFLATRADIVGPRIAADLATLQDAMEPFAQAEAIAAIEVAFAAPYGTLYREIGPAIAAASVAQVHKATTIDGRIVAVKVLRPGIRARFARDLADMRFAGELAERFSQEARRLRMVESFATLARSVTLELDLRIEAAALSELGENTANDPDFCVPKPDWELTARDVLTTTWVDGTKIADLAALDTAGHDRRKLARIVVQSFLKQAIGQGFFHADMHPGNLFVDPDGRLVAVDGGIMGRIGLKERRFLAEILLGFITRDYLKVAQVHFEAGYVPGHHSVEEFAQAIRAVGEPIFDRRADQISMAKLLTLLFEITGIFDMRTRTELIMLQRTMVVVEGVGRMLDPGFDMWRTAEPVLRDWITRNLGPIGKIEEAGRGLAALVGSLGQIPGHITRAEQVLVALEQQVSTGLGPNAENSFSGRSLAGSSASHKALTLGVWALVALAAYALWLQS